MGRLVKTLDNLIVYWSDATTTKSVNLPDIEAWNMVYLSHASYDELVHIIAWCENQFDCNEWYPASDYKWYFKNKSDATLFRLTWQTEEDIKHSHV